jgi:AhpD family alkylhydroperoxidase
MISTPRSPKAKMTASTGTRGRLSREHVGDVPESAKVTWHNQAVLTSFTWFGRKAQKWDQRNPDLQSLAHLAVAALTGCSRCLDFGYLAAHNEGLDEAKDNEVPRWRESTVVTSLERDVIEHTEATVGERPPADCRHVVRPAARAGRCAGHG